MKPFKSESWQAPASAHIDVHNVDNLEASSNQGCAGTFRMKFFSMENVAIDICIFTGDAKLAADLALAMNRAMAEYRAALTPSVDPAIEETA